MDGSSVQNPVMPQRLGGGAGPEKGEGESSSSNNLQEFPPPDHLLFSVVATVFFLPLGIAAIMEALKVQKAISMSDMRTAHHASRQASRYAMAGVFLGSNLAVAVSTVVFCIVYSSV